MPASSSSSSRARVRRVPAARAPGPARTSGWWRPPCGWCFVGLCVLIAAILVAMAFSRGFARRQGRHARGRRRRGAGVADAATRRVSDRPSGWRGSIGWRSSGATPSTPAPRSSGWCSAWCRPSPPRSRASPTSCASGATQDTLFGDMALRAARRGAQLVERRAGDAGLRVQHPQHRAGDVPRRQGARQPHREPAGHRDGGDGGGVQPAVARGAGRHRHAARRVHPGLARPRRPRAGRHRLRVRAAPVPRRLDRPVARART